MEENQRCNYFDDIPSSPLPPPHDDCHSCTISTRSKEKNLNFIIASTHMSPFTIVEDTIMDMFDSDQISPLPSAQAIDTNTDINNNTNNSEDEQSSSHQHINDNNRRRAARPRKLAKALDKRTHLIFKPFDSFSAIEDTVRELNSYYKQFRR